MSIGGFFKGIGKGIVKGVAGVIRHPEVLQGAIEAAQQIQAARAAKKDKK